MIDRRLHLIANNVERFSAFLKASRVSDDLETIFDEYAYMRRILRDGIAAVVKSSMPDAVEKLTIATDRVENRLRAYYPDLDKSSLQIRRYNTR